MRITCVIHSLHGGGAERVMAGLVNRLQQRGHQLTLITLDEGHQDRHAIAPAVQRVTLNLMQHSTSPAMGIRNTVRRCRALRKALQQSNPEVVLSFCDRTNVLVLLASYGLSIPIVVSERSDPAMQQLAVPWSWLRRRLYHRAQRVVTLTTSAAEFVKPWCQREPRVIPSAVELPPEFNKVIRSATDESSAGTIIGVGRLEHEKGFDRLITAFAKVSAKHSRWSLKIIGEGSLRGALQQQIDRSGLQTRIHMPGWVQPIWSELASADLFVLPSRYEGFPSALLEAMAAGLAVVAVDCESGPRAIITPDVNGLLVPNDVEALTLAMDRCLSEAKLRLALGQAASRITDRFGWEPMVDAYEQTLQDSINGR